jgi:hypothetical protein
MRRPCTCLILLSVGPLALTGCANQPRNGGAAITRPAGLPPTRGLSDPAYLEAVSATVVPPLGWRPDPLETQSRHTHQVWISPSGSTAYGVIRFSLPIPVGYDPVLWYFMREMRRSEGEAVLIGKQWDPNLRGMRFVAQGGKYTVRPNLFVRGFSGWVIYAGTLTGRPVNTGELELAERARERTMTGRVTATPVAVGDHPDR